MTPESAMFPLWFVGPIGFLLAALLVIIAIIVIARLIFSLSWKLLIIGAVVLGLLWIVGVFRLGPPGLA